MTIVDGIESEDIQMLMQAAEKAVNLYSDVSVPWIREKAGEPVPCWLRQMTARAIIMAHVSHGTALKSLDPGSMVELGKMIAQYLNHLEEKHSHYEAQQIIDNMMKSDA